MARRLVPAAYSGEFAVDDLTGQLIGKVAELAPHKQRDIRLILAAIGGRPAALLTIGVPRSFADLGTGQQDRFLNRWSTARLPVCRTAYQALRRLTMALYYSLPEGQRVAGYLGPFHLRRLRFEWEGPVASTDTDRTGSMPHGRLPQVGPWENADEWQLNDVVARGRLASDAPPTGWGSPPKIEDSADRPAAQHHFVADRIDIAPMSALPVPASRSTASASTALPGIAAPSIGRSSTRDGSPHHSASVVVIGTGAGGAVAAARLAEAGMDVVMLEAGSFYSGAMFTEREAEMTEQLYAERGARATDDLSFAILQGETVGGGTAVNWMIMLRTPDHVLDEWAQRHGVVGMAASEMRARFEQVELDVHARPVPADAHSPNNRLILDGARALGWHATEATINARGCVRSGFCGQGCRYDAKQGAHLTYVPRALRAGARLLTNARAERVTIVGREGRRSLKRVQATITDPATGRTSSMSIEAPTVVLAGGAIETPALLQRSGLGGGGVGRFLRLHPTTAVIGFYDRPIYAAAGIPLSAVCDEFSRSDANGYGFWIECPPLHPGLAAVASPGFGAEHAAMMHRFTNMGALIALVRDGADRDLSNGTVKIDKDGRPRINYRMGPRDSAHLRASIETAARLHLANGAREVRSLHTRPTVIRSERDLPLFRAASYAPNDIALFSAHVNGTCRIGTDPRTSGASPDFERHGAPGVFICDGSLLPTAPGVNPQETIMAVAMVVADRILALR